jgi:phosphoribosylformylglycinamidine synthase subunit PurS
MFSALLTVRPRPGVRDPQAEAVEEALGRLGFDGLSIPWVGRTLRLEVEAASVEQARHLVDELCRRLLVNPSIETYDVTVEER